MNQSHTDAPHGGDLVNILVDEERATLLKQIAMNLPDITLNHNQLCDLELLGNGAFSPLTGFMTGVEYASVLDRMKLQNGLPWPVPICLDVPESRAERLEAGQSVGLRDPEGFLLAILNIEDIWAYNKEREAVQLFDTTDRSHPGVDYLFEKKGSHYVGGTLEVISLPLHFDFKRIRMTPREIRNAYAKLGWKRIVGFQTRDIIHRPQFEITIRAMQAAKANLLVLPVVGTTKWGDIDYYTRVKCYKEVVKHYPPDAMIINLLPLSMRMAGPREALLHALIAKNYGCTHFIVGHNHASPGLDGENRPFYEDEHLREVIEANQDDLGIDILFFEKMVYLPFEDEYRPAGEVGPGSQTISLTGADIRQRIRTGKSIPEWATFAEVEREIRKAYPPPLKQGFTIFLTGLSGAGKSTIAKVLYSKMLEIGERPVTLLDGDIVRRNLSSELNFSKEHRDINVRRIGFVAMEITKNRGIAICAPIAPYAVTRDELRHTIEQYGGFIEIHVATPLAECEKRDRKGMYAKARAGLIKGYTGIDDPYEVPVSPELRIDTTNNTPEEAAHEIMLFLGQRGYI